jgi:hypothetical protein
MLQNYMPRTLKRKMRMPSYLEVARQHLMSCQRDLATVREAFIDDKVVKSYERYVLGALSWVWEEQERVDSTDGYVFGRQT